LTATAESRATLDVRPSHPREGIASIVNGTSIYAGFWRRVAAVIIDGILLGIVTAPLILALAGGNTYEQASRSASGSLVSTVVSWLYYALMESSAKQATLGKMALGIMVTDLEGRRIGFGRATGRYFAKILSALILGIGFLMAAFTARKQGLHDMIAGTLVIRGKAPSVPAPPLPPPPS
jgi:uncharacterized RDD family membrane protein YckC